MWKTTNAKENGNLDTKKRTEKSKREELQMLNGAAESAIEVEDQRLAPWEQTVGVVRLLANSRQERSNEP